MSPLISIWLKPRETIRQIIKSEPQQYIIVLAMLAGLAQVFNQAVGNNVGEGATLPVVLIAILVVGPIVGLVSLYLGAAVLQWVSGRFGGQGSVVEFRTVIAWTGLPLIVTLVFFAPEVFLFGLDLFANPETIVEAGGGLGPAFIFFGLLEIILAVWAFVLLVLGIAEVGQVSGWLALVLSIVPTYIASTTASIIVSVVPLL